ncbi:FAD-dependent monooxygenase [Streptomyces sp. CRPSP2-6A1]|uniref:FAD-dependent monooxygenase n=1 Tax=Streptomyces sp. CRPSP2-6A1 TaxID=2799588 RepID=UPI0018F0716C|nr:FAD-dependent monooxygenase [Streptomyces sp. CRPSP2-6A1]MBJ6999537.1 FAD-dependent monooxygenase [Streptomyces sp. CRPSP2-6A1]
MTPYDEAVPVLIVGGGYAGLATSLFLAHQGVRSLLVDRHAGVAVQGRARGINPRTMEIYRPLGLEAEIKEAGRPFDADSGVVRCANLSSEWHWILEQDSPRALPEFTAGEFGMADQSTVEPVLAKSARAQGAEIRHHTQCVSVEQDADGVTAVIEDRATSERRTVRAQYLVACDGYRGTVRDGLGIARTGRGTIRSYVSFVIKADLSDLIEKTALFWIIGGEGVAGGFVTHAQPNHWGVALTYDPAVESPEDYTLERCAAAAQALIGRDVPVEVVDKASWEEAVGVADSYRAGRVFLVGDAAHVWPPAGALGANSAVQDAHNLAWKLAAVIRGQAGDGLLDSYEDERRAVAMELADLTVRSQESRFGPTPKEDPLEPTLCILAQRYRSSAMIGAEHTGVIGEQVDQHARPGTRAPHLWLDHNGRRIGVHDLFHDAFTLVTGPSGDEWTSAAAEATERTSVPVRAYRIGPAASGAELTDVESEWASRYRLGQGGAALIRPDGYVAWRSEDLPAHPGTALTDALRRILSVSS